MLVPLRVREIMTPTVETVGPSLSVPAAADRMRSAGVGSLLVVSEGSPVGIVTNGDLVTVLAEGREGATTAIEDVMSPSPVTVDEATSIEGAARILREHGFQHLPVTRGDAVVGMVSSTDVTYALERLSMREIGEYALLEGNGEVAYEAPDWESSHVDGDADEAVSVGDTVRFTKELTDVDVRAFAEASGDTNRLHLDDEFAEGTRFGRRIVHGTLVSGLLSAALARFPGLTIYLSQELHFRAPVDVGDAVTAVCEAVEDLGNDKYRLATAVYDGDGERVVEGEAIVLVDDLPVPEEEKLEPVGTGADAED